MLNTKKEKSELESEKELLTRAKRKLTELELNQKQGELHAAADVEFAANMIIAFKAKLETLPDKLLPLLMQVPPENPGEYITAILRAGLNKQGTTGNTERFMR